MIARVWRGVVRCEDADAYAAHILDTGFARLSVTNGNRGAWVLRRDDADRTEFVVFSLWDSLDAVRAFAGDDIDEAASYPEDARYLIDHDPTVFHYEVAGQP